MNYTDTNGGELNLAARRSVIVWSLHWITAALALYLISTSVGSGLGIAQRVFPAVWMNWHLSAGMALLGITLVRLYTSHPWRGLLAILTFKALYQVAMRSVLLVVVFATTLTGSVIYQKPPFGPIGYIFGLVAMPTLISFQHSYHNVIIDFHISLAVAMSVLILSHVYFDRKRIVHMLWPWRRFQ